MPIDEPVTSADVLFTVLRTLKTHEKPYILWRNTYIGCLECDPLGCRQFDWAVEKWAELAAAILTK